MIVSGVQVKTIVVSYLSWPYFYCFLLASRVTLLLKHIIIITSPIVLVSDEKHETMVTPLVDCLIHALCLFSCVPASCKFFAFFAASLVSHSCWSLGYIWRHKRPTSPESLRSFSLESNEKCSRIVYQGLSSKIHRQYDFSHLCINGFPTKIQHHYGFSGGCCCCCCCCSCCCRLRALNLSLSRSTPALITSLSRTWE